MRQAALIDGHDALLTGLSLTSFSSTSSATGSGFPSFSSLQLHLKFLVSHLSLCFLCFPCPFGPHFSDWWFVFLSAFAGSLSTPTEAGLADNLVGFSWARPLLPLLNWSSSWALWLFHQHIWCQSCLLQSLAPWLPQPRLLRKSLIFEVKYYSKIDL